MMSMYRNSLLSTTRGHAVSSQRLFQSTTMKLKSAATGTPVASSVRAQSSAMCKIKSFPKENPFAFQLFIATAKTSAADIMVQTVVERKNFKEIDWKRNGIFVVFGFAYLGCFQYWIMVTKYRQWFPTMDRFAKLSLAGKIKDTAGILDAMKMVAFDVFVHLPWMYFPTYYTTKEFVSGDTWNPVDWVRDGVTKYKNNMKDDLTAMIKLWGPSDCVQFVLPMHIRMPFRHMVSFFWTAYVSFTRGSIEPDEETDEATAKAADEKISRRLSVTATMHPTNDKGP